MTWQMLRGDCVELLPSVGKVDHLISDPPYSEHVHRSVRTSGRNVAPDVVDFACRTRRTVDLGFEHLDEGIRVAVALWAAVNVARWTAVFSDIESSHLWREELEAQGLNYKRTAVWVRQGGAPQFTGDRPASGVEAITLAHPKGRSRWNGGGKAGVYTHPVVQNRLGQRGSRVHPTQKPLALMLALVEDFTSPGDLVLDPFAGSGTTGVACLRLGRRFIGIEQDAEHYETARERLEAEERGLSLQAARAGQEALFR